MPTASAWFQRHRTLTVSAGLGMAPVTIAPFAQWLLLSGYDWRTAQLVIGLVAWAVLLAAALLLRRPPAMTPHDHCVRHGFRRAGGRGLHRAPSPGHAAIHGARGDLLRLPPSPFSGPIFHVVSYAMVCGLPGLAGLGVLADRRDAEQVLTGGVPVQVLAIGAFLPARSLGEFSAVADHGLLPHHDVGANGRCLDLRQLRRDAPQLPGTGLGAMAIAFSFPLLPRMRAERLELA